MGEFPWAFLLGESIEFLLDVGLVGAAEGALGTGMKDEVEKAYDFLASNYRPGDEVSFDAVFCFFQYWSDRLVLIFGVLGNRSSCLGLAGARILFECLPI